MLNDFLILELYRDSTKLFNRFLSKGKFPKSWKSASVVPISKSDQIGRLPLNISSSFSSFTIDQYRNLTTIFSAVS